LEENAVKTPKQFLAKFNDSIVATLGCFDRVIFKGYLPLGGNEYLNIWIDRVLMIQRKDFLPRVQPMSQQLVDEAQQQAKKAGAEYRYLKGRGKKERIVDEIARQRRHPEGLLAVLCCLETCRTVKLRWDKNHPRITFTRRLQRVLYFYYLDPEFGRMFVRLETWFPFTIQVYVNGHEWLARQLARQRSGFVQHDNAFTELDEPSVAQELADRFVRLSWRYQLNRWAKIVNPLLQHEWFRDMQYRWVIDQSEYSTDVIFRDRASLAALYKRLLDHAVINFSAQDILTFLGRRLQHRFDGEVLTDCKKDRWPGARIKHRMKNNWLKMYDKFGQVLRIETVINQPREFKVRRKRERKGVRQLVWCPMSKGIANLYQYEAKMQDANQRYLNALSAVADPAPAYRQVVSLVEPKVVQRRRYAGFNPARQQDVRLFAAVLRGEHLLRGFRNTDIRRHLYGETPCAETRRRQSAAVSRLLKRLHVRHLIKKIPRTRRWQLSAAGEKVLGTSVRLYYRDLTQAA